MSKCKNLQNFLAFKPALLIHNFIKQLNAIHKYLLNHKNTKTHKNNMISTIKIMDICIVMAKKEILFSKIYQSY